MSYLRMTAPGWETFTGDMAGIAFEDGVSTDHVPRAMIDRIAALIAVVLVDENGKGNQAAGPAARLLTREEVESEPVSALQTQSLAEKAKELRKVAAETETNPAGKIYTPEELTQIADKEGIKGLRKIADPWGVHDRKIKNMIIEILSAQKEWEDRVAEKKAEERKIRAAAEAEALAKQEADRVAFETNARMSSQTVPAPSDPEPALAPAEDLITATGLSDAIGPSGENVSSAAKPKEEEGDPLEKILNSDEEGK